MEMSSVGILVHGSLELNGAAAGEQTQNVLDTTPDQNSSTTSSSASSPLFAASPAAGSQQPEGGSSGGAAVVVTVDGAGRRAKALKSLKESIPHQLKLQSLQNSERKYQKEGSWHKKSVRRLSKELYVIVSLYAIVQSALFSAVAQTSIIQCDDLWGLVGIAAMVTLGTFKCAVDKLCSIGEQQEKVLLFQARQNAVYDNIDLLYLHGSACNLDSLEPESALGPSNDPGIRCVSSVRGYLVLGFLVGFAALIIFSCWGTLCSPPCKCKSQ